MELCLESERRPGARVERRWWEQGGLDSEGVRKMERAAVADAYAEAEEDEEVEVEVEVEAAEEEEERM